MSLIENIIVENVTGFNESIKDTIIKKRINDTGSAARSLKVVVVGNKVQSVGNDYIEVLDRGRRPGKFAPVDNIRDWVRSKLGLTEPKEINSVAYLVNRKIALAGTEIFLNPSRGLQIDNKISDMRKKLNKDLRIHAVVEVKKILNKFKL